MAGEMSFLIITIKIPLLFYIPQGAGSKDLFSDLRGMTPLTTLGNDTVLCLEYRVPFWLLWACTGQRRPVVGQPGRALAGGVPSVHWLQQMLLGRAWSDHIPAGHARRTG